MRMTKLLPALLLALLLLLTAVAAGCRSMRGPATRPADDAAEPKRAADPADEDADAKKPQKTLYERIGGERTIVAVVDDLVARAAADPKVNFTRNSAPHPWQATPENVARLKTRLVQFLGTATGGPQRYEGEDMRTAHRGMQISSAEFTAFVKGFQASLEHAGVKAKERKELLEIVESARGTVVEERAKP